MNKNQDMISFFDQHAANWDKKERKDLNQIEKIFTLLKFPENARVLDIGCGTGIMFNYYLKYHFSEIIGIDISPKMCQTAAQKFLGQKSVKVINQDISDYANQEFEEGTNQFFDLIMIYNSYPHLIDRKALIGKISTLTQTGAKVIIAHGNNRESINHMHHEQDNRLSFPIKSVDEEIKPWLENFTLKNSIDDEQMYFIELERK